MLKTCEIYVELPKEDAFANVTLACDLSFYGGFPQVVYTSATMCYLSFLQKLLNQLQYFVTMCETK